jgi:hypothetical protein
MKFIVYLSFALSPLVATLLHDVFIDHAKASTFLPIGYYIYNYLPQLFSTIKSTFITSELRDIVSILMKTPLIVYSGIFSMSLGSYLIHAKLNNAGPFKDYLHGLPQIEKKWLNKDRLKTRFSAEKSQPKPSKTAKKATP